MKEALRYGDFGPELIFIFIKLSILLLYLNHWNSFWEILFFSLTDFEENLLPITLYLSLYSNFDPLRSH
jgi:hypothetical protein